jgi:glycosyltransferase involved in cell wall biosynthesis
VTLGKNPTVSVIIPSKNSAHFIARTLRSLEAQTYKDFEVIVVDAFSVDGTQEIVKSFPQVILLEQGGERSRQTNEGFRIARGKYLWRTDADVVFDPTLIGEAVAKLESGFDALTIPGTSDVQAGFWAEVHKRERDALVGDWLRTGPSFYRAEVFSRLGGFNERLFAFEDHDFHNRIKAANFRIGSIKAKTTHLGEPTSLGKIVSKYIYYGDRRNLMEFVKENPGKGLWQITPLRIVYIRNIRTFGLYFFPFLVFHYVRYVSALTGFLTSDERE